MRGRAFPAQNSPSVGWLRFGGEFRPHGRGVEDTAQGSYEILRVGPMLVGCARSGCTSEEESSFPQA